MASSVDRSRIRRLADTVDHALREASTPERAVSEKAYLKSDLVHYGATVPATRAIAKAFAKGQPEMTRAEIAALVEELWGRGVFELRNVAVEIVVCYAARLEAEDVCLVERMLRDAHTWALVDNLAVTLMGRLVARFPTLTRTLDRWAKDDDFWIRRSAMLALLPGLRKGKGDFPRFARYADAMIEERELFIRKAIGWILRESYRHYPEEVFAFVSERAHRASGLTVREAVKRMPKARADAITKAHRGGR